ncbi:MAG: RcnB family protein [Thermomonas sp.]
MKNTMFKQLTLAAAIGTLALAAPTAFAHDQSKGHGKHQNKAAKDYRKAVKKAHKEEAKAYKRWAKGQNIPHEYVVERYYVRDYRAYNLAQPPSGYMWVRPYPQDNTYYMVQLASGLISQIFGR